DAPARRWYLRPLNTELIRLPAAQRVSIARQAVIGWLQTILLVIAIAQSLFAGALHLLPPELRPALSFLHRIEWAAYLGIVLIAAQIVAGWPEQIVVTNRFFLLAYRLSKPRLLFGASARHMLIVYGAIALLIAAAIVWVNAHGFIIQPTGR
ncbi:MAG TPA: hypothetical protein VMT24_02730, partial [Aggregatilineaceae bacterium]|nr:hypothetical protein [Aggregatilineaceae bacterium]